MIELIYKNIAKTFFRVGEYEYKILRWHNAPDELKRATMLEF